LEKKENQEGLEPEYLKLEEELFQIFKDYEEKPVVSFKYNPS
jgi:hypothetical protein